MENNDIIYHTDGSVTYKFPDGTYQTISAEEYQRVKDSVKETSQMLNQVFDNLNNYDDGEDY